MRIRLFTLLAVGIPAHSSAFLPTVVPPTPRVPVTLEVRSDEATPVVFGTAEVLAPSGETLWSAEWTTADAGGQLEGRVPFQEAGDYGLRVSFPSGRDGGTLLTRKLPLSSAESRVDVYLSMSRDLPTQASAFLNAVVSRNGGLSLRLQTIREPTSGSPALYRISNAGTSSYLVLPSVRLVPPTPEGTVPSWRYWRDGLERGVGCTWDRMVQKRHLAPGGFVLVDESSLYCAYHRTPPGNYEQLFSLLEISSNDDPMATRQVVLLRHRFHVTSDTPVPPPRNLFERVPVAKLQVDGTYADLLLKAPDGGTACVCKGAIVGAEHLPVVELQWQSLTLGVDGGQPIVLETGTIHQMGDYPTGFDLTNF